MAFERVTPRRAGAFIRRVVLRNYKSIEACDVRLGSLTFLVGQNGAGKSNFLDALRLIRDALNAPLDHALRERGGLGDVRRRSTGHPRNLGIRIEFELPSGQIGFYSFEVASRKAGAFQIRREACRFGHVEPVLFDVRAGEVRSCSLPHPPAAADDRLFLLNLSGTPEFRPLYDALSRMGFYNLNPAAIRDVQPPDPGGTLERDGRNLASVLGRLQNESPTVSERITAYLRAVVPGIEGVDRVPVAHRETLQFRQRVRGAEHPWRFTANSMSDGTLRGLGVLVALFQTTPGRGAAVPFVGIEEPEAALHPAAARLLLDALREASRRTQIVVTSHSPELLDQPDIQETEVRAVLSEEGRSAIGRIDAAAREALKQHLYTAGELLEMDQLFPERSAQSLTDQQLHLFEDVARP